MTWSPTRSAETSAPTSVTTPAPSPPITSAPGYMPSAMRTSRKFSPAARMATRTSPGPSASVAWEEAARTRRSSEPADDTSSRQPSPSADGTVRAIGAPIPVPEGAPVIVPACVAVGPGRPPASRGTSNSPSRTASCVSPAAASAGTASSGGTQPARPSRSTTTILPGFSACAERSSPHREAIARSSGRSPPRAATERRVTTASSESVKRASASHSCTSARDWCAAVCHRDGLIHDGLRLGGRTYQHQVGGGTAPLSSARASAGRSAYVVTVASGGRPSPSSADSAGPTGRAGASMRAICRGGRTAAPSGTVMGTQVR